MNHYNKKIKLGIYSLAILMMGVIGISSSLSVIGQHFPDISQTMIQNMISIPCIVMIPVTIMAGRLMQTISKKSLSILGVVLFLIGGIGPAFMPLFLLTLILRGIFGVGVGIIQVVSTTLVAANFEGAEREKVQGNLQAFQMLGCAAMVFTGGFLASVRWDLVFYIHLLAVITLVTVTVCLPNGDSNKTRKSAPGNHKIVLNKTLWIWVAVCFLLFSTGQIYSISFSYLITEKAIGDSAAVGLGMAFFCFGGIFMGLFYGKLIKAIGRFSMGAGFLLLAASFLIMVIAPNMVVCYLGCLTLGLGTSVVMPGVFLNIAGSVNVYSTGIAISIATCVQNFGQFCCPYIINPLAAAFGDGSNNNIVAFYIAFCLSVLLGISMLVYTAFPHKTKALQ